MFHILSWTRYHRFLHSLTYKASYSKLGTVYQNCFSFITSFEMSSSPEQTQFVKPISQRFLFTTDPVIVENTNLSGLRFSIKIHAMCTNDLSWFIGQWWMSHNHLSQINYLLNCIPITVCIRKTIQFKLYCSWHVEHYLMF